MRSYGLRHPAWLPVAPCLSRSIQEGRVPETVVGSVRQLA